MQRGPVGPSETRGEVSEQNAGPEGAEDTPPATHFFALTDFRDPTTRPRRGRGISDGRDDLRIRAATVSKRLRKKTPEVRLRKELSPQES